jgi:hypothetical protein
MLTLSFTGCGLTSHEPTTYANYIYQNESSSDIMIKSYSPFVRDGEILFSKDSIFYILKGEQAEVTCRIKPLNWHRYNSFDNDSVIISNGNIEIINRKWENDPLYVESAYKLISIEGKMREKTYQFTFTDAFFE